ncbi:MAG: hypothetical protein IJ950_02415, partial [Helicobacter sp.]|nr:hypothetical protein [Helicobacter sp.]
ITPTRKGPCGSVHLNMLLREALNPSAKGKTEIRIGETVFRVGDIGSVALGGCSGEHKQKEVIKGKSKKQEVLYRSDTKYWQEYFSVAR